MNVKLLDCTLRDGAHVVSGNFGIDHIKNIISNLTEAGVDIIEIGFLQNCIYDRNKTFFPRIENAYNILQDIPSNNDVEYALMVRADQYDIDQLSECDNRITIIRVAFYYDYLEKGIQYAKQVMGKGYKCSLNLINTPGLTHEKLDRFVELANSIKPFAVSIVDTFGVMDPRELLSISSNYDLKLDKNITMGLHVHENLSSSMALAQTFLSNISEERNTIVDGSLMGIGRAPGNLCTELIANYLCNYYGNRIHGKQILDAIEINIKTLKEKYKWGYSPAYFSSAKYRVHRSYAEYLDELGIDLKSIDCLLAKIDEFHAEKYDRDYMDRLLKNES